jgi:hypothetical protein
MGGEGVGELRLVGPDTGSTARDASAGGEDAVVGVGKGLGGFEKACVDVEMAYETGHAARSLECHHGGSAVALSTQAMWEIPKQTS